MFQLWKRRPSNTTPVDYAAEWRSLQQRYADPAMELATTKQAIVVGAASVLDRLWNGNGGLGWDESCEEDYVAPLREHLVSRDVFSERQCDEISAKLDAIVAIGRKNMERIAAAGDGEATLDSSAVDVDYIVRRVVDWCRHFPTPIPIKSEDEYHGHF
jgi:hypothetical protein